MRKLIEFWLMIALFAFIGWLIAKALGLSLEDFR